MVSPVIKLEEPAVSNPTAIAGWDTTVLSVIILLGVIGLLAFLVGPLRRQRRETSSQSETRSPGIKLTGETEALARRLASAQNCSIDDTIRLALEEKEDEEEEGGSVPKANWKKALHTRSHLLFWFGIVLILAGAALGKTWVEFFVPSKEIVATFVGELGFATLIAYFVSTGIESIARERHNANVLKQIKRIKRDVFEAIYKKDHDPRLIDFIDSNIFRHPFYRTDFSLRVRICYLDDCDYAKVPNAEDPVLVHVTSRNVVKNISTVDHEYPINVFIEKPYIQTLKPRVGLKGLTINGAPLSAADLQDALKEETEDFLRYEKIVPIGKKESVVVQSDLCCVKFARDEMPWRSHDTSNGFYVSVEHPPGIKADALPIHRNTSIRPQHNAGAQLELRIDEPLFPHNGVTIWWAPQNVTTRNEADGT
ncbi:MAG: hypothetical protein U1E20_06270 [Methylocystis sp.]|uniref:hypothetical protein n=1 Tax=Methylocystis sp. TaxID=1911079 RepID=UPI003922AD60